jgi:hypothetical protein
MPLRCLLTLLLVLSGCTVTPPASVCIPEAMGWTFLDVPPPEASEIRQALYHDRSFQKPPHVPEYWFLAPDGRVLLCEPERMDGCGTNLGVLRKTEHGWVLEEDSPLVVVCFKH